jgi:hypothetical protein
MQMQANLRYLGFEEAKSEALHALETCTKINASVFLPTSTPGPEVRLFGLDKS